MGFILYVGRGGAGVHGLVRFHTGDVRQSRFHVSGAQVFHKFRSDYSHGGRYVFKACVQAAACQGVAGLVAGITGGVDFKGRQFEYFCVFRFLRQYAYAG